MDDTPGKLITTSQAYSAFLNEVKRQIHVSRVQVARTANRRLTQLYWWLGQQIVENQAMHGWGKSVVEQLSKDLRKTFESTSGFSVQNLWYMRQFYLEYKDQPNLQQLVGEIPWSQNLIIMAKVKDIKAREYYLNATSELGWSRNVLTLQIQSKAYERHVLTPKQHNFAQTLPQDFAEQADQAMKDVYMLDSLGITRPVVEKVLEQRMVSKIKDVMLEMGYGFAFIGNQYRIATKDKEYFIDLLFYNRRLQGLVALEIKVGKFKPEYAGKMNFYLNLLDDFVREPHERHSIGIILCAERDHFEVEYALRGIDKPVGVAEFRLTKELPKELHTLLPDPKEIEVEIMRELGAEMPSQSNQEETQ